MIGREQESILKGFKMKNLDAATISCIMENFTLNYDTTDDDTLHEAYDAMLEECSTCETCGRGGSDLKESDPTAYRCGFNDWLDGEVKSETYFQVDDEYFTDDQIHELKDAIVEAVEALF